MKEFSVIIVTLLKIKDQTQILSGYTKRSEIMSQGKATDLGQSLPCTEDLPGNAIIPLQTVLETAGSAAIPEGKVRRRIHIVVASPRFHRARLSREVRAKETPVPSPRA